MTDELTETDIRTTDDRDQLWRWIVGRRTTFETPSVDDMLGDLESALDGGDEAMWYGTTDKGYKVEFRDDFTVYGDDMWIASAKAWLIAEVRGYVD